MNLDEGTSWMWDHFQASHGPHHSINPQEDFTFNIINLFKDPMTRQILEAIRIQLALGNGTHQDKKGFKHPIVSLNRKNEFFAQRKRFDLELG